MRTGRAKNIGASARREEAQTSGTGRILVVGEVQRWRASGRDLPHSGDVSYVEFSDLTPELLELLRPATVLSPLLCASFDCLDVAQLLHDSGYRGSYRVMSTDLPDPLLIRAEIEATCPHLDFDVLNLMNGTGQRPH